MPKQLRLSVELKKIAERCHTDDVTVGELSEIIKGSPYFLLIALLSLPFMLPIPGLAVFISIPIGLLFTLIGVRITLGQKPLIPESLKKVKLSKKIFPAMLKGASGLLKAIEKVARPRFRALFIKPMMQFYGILIILTAIMLMPPWPIPYANFMPALTLFLAGIALIQKDGLFMLLTFVSFAGTIYYYYLVKEGLITLWEKIFG